MPPPVRSALPEERGYDRRRAALVETLRAKGIADERVLEAVRRVPRHLFVWDSQRHLAYQDVALPIGQGQTISQPFTVAVQTALLGVEPGDRVLEIGTGSGYQAAVLAELGVRVHSVERHADLLASTAALLTTLGYRVQTRAGDGTLGWPTFAPFDAIVVTAGAIGIPDALRAQLALPTATRAGGRLVIPVGDESGQTMRRLTRTGEDTFHDEAFGDFRFVPFVQGR